MLELVFRQLFENHSNKKINYNKIETFVGSQGVISNILVIDQINYTKCSCHAFSSKMLLVFVLKTKHPDIKEV